MSFGRAASDVRDQLPVRTPRRAAAEIRITVGALKGGQLPFGCPRARSDGVEVPVLGPIGIGAPLGHEGNRIAVGGPGGQQVVVIAGRERLTTAGTEIQHLEMLAAVIEIALLVLLELEPIEHDGTRALGRRARTGVRRNAIGVGILHHQRQPLPVRSPCVILDAAGKSGHPLGLTAAAIQQPELLGVVRIVPVGEEREPPAVRAPLGSVLRFGRRGQPDRTGPIPARHPDVALSPVAQGIDGGDGVADPGAVGRDRWIGDSANARHVIESEGTSGGRLGSRCGHGDAERYQRDQGSGQASARRPGRAHCATARPVGSPASL